MSVTHTERAALAEIARRGGSLPGGRQNTTATNRLIAKGLVESTRDARRVAITTAGTDLLRAWIAKIDDLKVDVTGEHVDPVIRSAAADTRTYFAEMSA